MADRLSLGLGPEVRKLKLGESFSKNGNTAFHTFRYDFKPASMDTKKMATVEIGASNQTTVAVPNVDSAAGTSHTVFKGPRKPYTKECVLIIDHVTGEIVLEKLSSNVQLKKTRTEGSSKMQPGTGMSGDPPPPQPTPTTNFKKASPPQQQQKYSPNQRPPSHSPQQRTPPNHHATSPSEVGSSHGGGSAGRSPVNQRSPSMPSLVPPPSHAKASSVGGSSSSSYAANKEIGSMPVFTDSDFSVVAPEQAPEQPADAASEVGILSDSSNDSSSGSSSSSSDSSDSEGEDKDLRRAPASVEHPMSNSQYSSSSSSSAYPNMPCFSQLSQLSEDLQLSESESEAD